ncbi:MAG: hypothetical protein IPN49_14495 [Saprospiraceae bacterium]|nr:hypothetical protein [Saprospiraceae bacterium]MBK6566467.1 hypothetical protein [Saprospiraceae bacterium]MBK6783503.1 hypothetical protein [Saprospiraceae bacterium]MBK7524407.1 hypothetical protein [Saprospiraceae bacterium]MBK8080929.1 hypothetical protein [Saprospiraceae bacterium]
MKLYSAIFFLSLLPAFLMSQDICKGYFVFEDGSSWTMTNFDKKKKKTGSISYELDWTEDEGGVKSMTYLYTSSDEDDEKIAEGKFTATCSDNTFSTSFSGLFGESIPETSDIQVEISGDLIQYTNEMTAGQKLPDASIVVSSKIENGLNLFKVTNDITNRKVIGFEKVITPAGTFDCVKITYEAKIKMLISRTVTVVEYLAKGKGVVRSESYNKKGELTGYTELTEWRKG